MPDALVEIHNHIMTVTLNRPARKNAMTLHMFARMDDAWRQASEDPDIRVCILTGADGNFSSGMDLRAMAGDVDKSDDLDVDSAHESRFGIHLPRVVEDGTSDQAGDRRGRRCRHRGRNRDPAGHRHSYRW